MAIKKWKRHFGKVWKLYKARKLPKSAINSSGWWQVSVVSGLETRWVLHTLYYSERESQAGCQGGKEWESHTFTLPKPPSLLGHPEEDKKNNKEPEEKVGNSLRQVKSERVFLQIISGIFPLMHCTILPCFSSAVLRSSFYRKLDMCDVLLKFSTILGVWKHIRTFTHNTFDKSIRGCAMGFFEGEKSVGRF